MTKKDNSISADQIHEKEKSSEDSADVQPEKTVVKNAHATGDGAMGRHDEETKEDPFPDISI